MFPKKSTDPYINSDGTRTTLGSKIESGGGGDPYVLPVATAETLGGVKVGSGLEITENGVLSATGGGGGGGTSIETQTVNISGTYTQGSVLFYEFTPTTGKTPISFTIEEKHYANRNFITCLDKHNDGKWGILIYRPDDGSGALTMNLTATIYLV